MLSRFRWLNPVLQRFGRKIIESRIGHWHVVDGKAKRTSIPAGFRLARKGEWEGVKDDATELERFAAANAKHIAEVERQLRISH